MSREAVVVGGVGGLAAARAFLGQGAGRALEDAVVLGACPRDGRDVPSGLPAYDDARRPRAQAVARDSGRAGRVGQQVSAPLAVVARDTAVRLLPSGLVLRAMARWARWDPPP